jgi:hypothetical protein
MLIKKEKYILHRQYILCIVQITYKFYLVTGGTKTLAASLVSSR